MNASPRALQTLQSIVSQSQRQNSGDDTIETAKEAIQWISEKRRSASGPASDDDEAKRTVLQNMFLAGGDSGSVSFDQISFSKNRERVLVSVEILAKNGNPEGYDIVLQREGERWTIIGAWLFWAGTNVPSR